MASKDNQAVLRHLEQDVDYHLEIVRGLIVEANTLPNCIESQCYSSKYSISSTKRGKLFRWMIETLDKFIHDCPDPKSCTYRCGPKCPSTCEVRCTGSCLKKPSLSFKTRQLTFFLVDMYLSQVIIPDDELQLLATACFFLAAKFEESYMLTLQDACTVGDDLYSPEEVADMEISIVKQLQWKVHYPTAGEIARRLLLSFKLPEKVDLDMLFKQVDNFIEFCLVEHDLSRFGLTTIAITSVICTFERAGMAPLGTEFACTASEYFNLNTTNIQSCVNSVYQIFDCSEEDQVDTSTNRSQENCSQCYEEDNSELQQMNSPMLSDEELALINNHRMCDEKATTYRSLSQTTSSTHRSRDDMDIVNEDVNSNCCTPCGHQNDFVVPNRQEVLKKAVEDAQSGEKMPAPKKNCQTYTMQAPMESCNQENICPVKNDSNMFEEHILGRKLYSEQSDQN